MGGSTNEHTNEASKSWSLEHLPHLPRRLRWHKIKRKICLLPLIAL